ncbi:uncharacterized protein LOC128554603 [Mercenaria mercenaria]|uniref:uncharacterized protein LOC128554603 n=1 Tax=Mercenaria mercenaria TaxID=6596 RepID=UPI00234E8EAD|nr:uncharacterized protein LOC128554603 [Mercenaria mercenaria]
MEQTVINLLQKVDRRLENIETQIYKQNDRLNSLEKIVKLTSAQSKLDSQDSGTKTTVSLGESDNFLNHVKAELRNVGKGITGDGKIRPKIKKTSSFNEKPSVKPVRVRRSPHTIPSDKDEERRINSFRRECLSKAIQWNLVDLINAVPEKHEFVLPKWLSREEVKFIMEGTDRKNHFRRFLCVLRKKEFGTMQEWLHICGFDEKVVKQVWETFQEFSDKDMNMSRLKCLRCRLIDGVSVVKVADYLYSADILTSEQEYLRISSSERPVGAQDELWKYVLQQCEKYICPEVVAIALKVALTDQLNIVDDDEILSYESLLNDIDTSDTRELLACSCNVRCSQSLHPPSCLKTMSLAGVYFSPPTRRKREKSSSSSGSPQSSSSSNSSVETICNSTNDERGDRNEDTLSPDNETFLKQPFGTTKNEKQKLDGNSTVSNLALRPRSARSRSLRRRSQQKVENFPSDSSIENFDRENLKAGPVRNSYKSVTSNLENKQSVIPVHANTVYIDTGTKYSIQLRKGISSESSTEH